MIGEFASEKKYGYPFGCGYPYDPIIPPELVSSSDEEVAKLMGWGNGCPVVGQLVTERGPITMRVRYSGINAAYTRVLLISRSNEEVYRSLNAVTERLVDEPVGIYEPQSVPESYLTHTYPLNRPAGYALGRIIAAISPDSDDIQLTRLLDSALRRSADDLMWLVEFGEILLNSSIVGKPDAKTILAIMFARAVVSEQNCWSLFERLGNYLDRAPRLKQEYINLSSSDKEINGIIDINTRRAVV